MDNVCEQALTYWTIAEAPHLQMFRCEPMRASISTGACATNWRASHGEGAERLFKCRTCPIGAVHAGETAASLNALRGALVCGRCHRASMRLVGKHLCVSCSNREREVIRGFNARGKAPQKHQGLHRRSLRVLEGGEPLTLRRELTSGVLELMVMALRDCDKRVVFCWDHKKPAHFYQRSLW